MHLAKLALQAYPKTLIRRFIHQDTLCIHTAAVVSRKEYPC